MGLGIALTVRRIRVKIEHEWTAVSLALTPAQTCSLVLTLLAPRRPLDSTSWLGLNLKFGFIARDAL